MVKCIAFAGRFVGIAAGNPLRATACPSKLCLGRKTWDSGKREKEDRRDNCLVPFSPRHGRSIPPAAAASQPKTEPNRIACSRSVHGNWIIVFQRLPPPTWIDGLTSRILPNPTRRIMKRASERPSEDLCPSVRPSI